MNRRITFALAVAALTLTAAYAGLGTSAVRSPGKSGQTDPPGSVPVLATVDPADLKEWGVSLSPPTRLAAVSKSSAERDALVQASSSTVLESTLTDCAYAREAPRTCWVVSVDPDSQESIGAVGPPGSNPHQKYTVTVVLIDAQTGEFLRGFRSARPLQVISSGS